jgi:hypothetical protein
VASYAALQLRPARLLSALSEALKQQHWPATLAMAGAWESVVLVWAFGRLEGRAAPVGSGEERRFLPSDPTLGNLLLEKATTMASFDGEEAKVDWPTTQLIDPPAPSRLPPSSPTR